MLDPSLPVEKLKNVGIRNLSRLNKLGIKTLKDLLWHFPIRYEDYSRVVPITDVQAGEKVNIQGEVLKIVNKRLFPKRMFITQALVKDESGAMNAVWFNQPYIANSLREGTFVSLAGKANLDKHGLYLSSPTYEKINELDFGIKKTNLTHTGGLIPVYPETEGVTSKYLRFLIKPILKNFAAPDPLPERLLKKYELPALREALLKIHYPLNLDEANMAKERLAFDDLLLFQLKALLERRKVNQLKSVSIRFDQKLIRNFVANLPFELTKDQKIAAWEILKDLQKKYPMNRLLEGDVGSGKTVVALIGAVQAVKAGYQSAFMAPTEVLAQQHYRTIKSLITNHQSPITNQVPNQKSQIKVALLTSATEEKARVKKAIADGEIDIIIGTHAVIQKDVKFKNLAFVIIDEQHRFGVNQRKALVRGTDADLTQNNTEGKILYEELSYKIRGLLFEVKKNLGLGHKELIYQNAFEEELKDKKVKYNKEKQIPILYGDKKVGVYQPDFVIEDKIIVEFKSISFLGYKEKKQIWTYLKDSKYQLAFLVNFGGTELDIQRIIYGFARPSASVPYSSTYIPHLLSMTATPIPRTLALTVYGDLDISIIKEKPKNRQKIITRVISPSQRKSAYKFIRDEVNSGRQVFVICPRIEPQNVAEQTQKNLEKIPQSSAFRPHSSALSQMRLVWAEAKAVQEEYKKLSEDILPDLKVGMLHGKMKPKEKNEMMNNFKDGKISILVSTSVVEVGVDIPNATIMMIENAERFGLAQLHQFRGRVGRGEHQSHCLLLSSTVDSLINKRLKALTECDDGFELAEKDMLIRGPGEFFGIKQSGLPDLAMASLANVELIKRARLEARFLLKEGPNLDNHPLLKEKLESFQRLTHFE